MKDFTGKIYLFNKLNPNGQALAFVLIALSLLAINAFLITSGSLTFFQQANYSVEKIQATNLAEAGIDKAIAALNQSSGSYNGTGKIALGPGEISISITNLTPYTKLVTSTGYVPSIANPKSRKQITIQVYQGIGTSFSYAMQVGDGGLVMADNVTVNGSVYSNGNIVMADNSIIKEDAFVAGGTQPVADQQSDCLVPNCGDYIFGKTLGTENRENVAQSFKPSSTNVLNKVSLKLKKMGLPVGNPTVRIMGDSNGKPDQNNILTSGILDSSQVSTSYGFVDVTFGNTPTLSANTSYWIMIHSNSLDENNYWIWSEDLLQGYTQGLAKWSSGWAIPNPIWTSINGSLGFKTYQGGLVTSITGLNNAIINGSAHAHLLQGLTINKDAYYQTILSSTVKGNSYPNSTDPLPQIMPISDSNISSWKNLAMAKGVFVGDITSCQDLPSGKYVGSLILNNGCTFKIFSPVYFTGDIILQNNAVKVSLDASYGKSSGVILNDGFIKIGDQVTVQGAGYAGSYLMLLSTFNSRDDPLKRNAIVTTDNLFNGILYSNLGSINVSNNGSFYQLSGWKILLADNITINYQSGVPSFFVGSGGYSIIKGTYQGR